MRRQALSTHSNFPSKFDAIINTNHTARRNDFSCDSTNLNWVIVGDQSKLKKSEHVIQGEQNVKKYYVSVWVSVDVYVKMSELEYFLTDNC